MKQRTGDTSNWEDKFFYRDIIGRYRQPVLDVGCGTGRLVLDYRPDGTDVDGVDNSPEMLTICRQKAQQLGLTPNLFEQGMALEHTEDRYEITLNGTTIASEFHRRESATRWYTQSQAAHLYQKTGFAAPKMFGGFTTETASEKDMVFSVLGVKL